MAASFLIAMYSHERGMTFATASNESSARKAYQARLASGLVSEITLLRIENGKTKILDKALPEKTGRYSSALSDRIAKGLADPITDEERRCAGSLRAEYQRKFGA